MYYQLISYLKFLVKSTNQHGIHSPFVFNLVTQCFYDKTNFSGYTKLADHRKRLCNSSKSIDITDFGQGSRVFKSNKREIAAIAKNAGISKKRQRLLFRIMRYLQIDTALELGTSLGLATAALSVANSSAKINTVEGCPNTSEVAKKHFNDFHLKNIKLHTKDFEAYLAENDSEEQQLVYIDGNHHKEKTLQYFKTLLKHTTNDSVFIFDDIYWSRQMTQAWQEIIKHPKVTVSIDTFYWGLVFFRSEQPKEHFNIRL
ncbi:MAG: putative O-methyltransferase YrrM [Ulvibacter sp.]|jgi:predicted O-methyltransferase YrrM|tara:strand:+ start:1365 stop:2138 length:774 start_codon:yes stop_codon:yes gene_type:complete